MKNLSRLSILLMLLTLTGCELIGDVFSAGFYTAIFLVVVVIAVIGYIVYRIKRR